jgi:general secretion pathway protein J
MRRAASLRSGIPAGGRSAGFSLVEVLVAATLLALLSAFLLGGLSLGIRAVAASDRHQDRSDQLANAYEFIRQQLARAQPIYEAARGQQPSSLMFHGSRDGIAFVNVAPPYLVDAAYQQFDIHLDRHPDRNRLVVRWHALRRWSASGGAAHNSLLLDGVASAIFGYFGRSAAGGAQRWMPEWTSQTLPLLVRLRLTFDDEAAPDLVVALRLADTSSRDDCPTGPGNGRKCPAAP